MTALLKNSSFPIPSASLKVFAEIFIINVHLSHGQALFLLSNWSAACSLLVKKGFRTYWTHVGISLPRLKCALRGIWGGNSLWQDIFTKLEAWLTLFTRHLTWVSFRNSYLLSVYHLYLETSDKICSFFFLILSRLHISGKHLSSPPERLANCKHLSFFNKKYIFNSTKNVGVEITSKPLLGFKFFCHINSCKECLVGGTPMIMSWKNGPVSPPSQCFRDPSGLRATWPCAVCMMGHASLLLRTYKIQ